MFGLQPFFNILNAHWHVVERHLGKLGVGEVISRLRQEEAECCCRCDLRFPAKLQMRRVSKLFILNVPKLYFFKSISPSSRSFSLLFQMAFSVFCQMIGAKETASTIGTLKSLESNFCVN